MEVEEEEPSHDTDEEEEVEEEEEEEAKDLDTIHQINATLNTETKHKAQQPWKLKTIP